MGPSRLVSNTEVPFINTLSIAIVCITQACMGSNWKSLITDLGIVWGPISTIPWHKNCHMMTLDHILNTAHDYIFRVNGCCKHVAACCQGSYVRQEQAMHWSSAAVACPKQQTQGAGEACSLCRHSPVQGKHFAMGYLKFMVSPWHEVTGKFLAQTDYFVSNVILIRQLPIVWYIRTLWSFQWNSYKNIIHVLIHRQQKQETSSFLFRNFLQKNSYILLIL